MGSPAKIDKLTGGVKRNHRLGRFFFHQLALENLIRPFVQLERFRLGNEFALVGQVLRRQLAHLFFNFSEVFLSKRLVAQKLIKKAGIDGRADTQLHVRIKLHHRGGKQVGRGMAEHKERVRIFLGEDLEFHIAFERAAQINQFALAVIRLGHASH